LVADAAGGTVPGRRWCMSELVKVIEVLAQSDKSWEDAAADAVKQASKTLKNIRSIYIENFEAKVEGNKIVRYRVNAKISFQLE
jgi:flavin-binding protein dodecin